MAKNKQNDGTTTENKEKRQLVGKKFSKDYQPTPEAKKKGHAKRKALKTLPFTLMNAETLAKSRKTAAKIGIDLVDEEFTIEVVMTLEQIWKAVSDGDTKAYCAAMDRMKGKADKRVVLGIQDLDEDILSEKDHEAYIMFLMFMSGRLEYNGGYIDTLLETARREARREKEQQE